MNCWFCSIRDAEEQHVFKVEMYGEVDAEKIKSQTKVAYKVQHIEIPRCNDCHNRHTIARLAGIFGILFFIAFLVAILFAVYQWTAPWIWGLWMGLAVGLLIASFSVRFLALRKISSVHQAKKAFPEIQEFLEKCYRFGYRPNEQMPESDQPCGQDIERPAQPK